MPRHVRLVAVQGPEARVVELVVAPAEGRVVSRVDREESRPALLITECGRAVTVLKEDPHWQEAMRRRGIEDFDLVQIDPWPSGHFGLNHETNRRIARCLSYLREAPDDNGYARPVEGVIGYVDLGRGATCSRCIDTGVVPVPPESGSYYPEDNGPLRSDLRPLEISQPEGPSFRVEGNLLEWQRWSMRLSMDPVEGLVLHQVGYRDGDRLRSILYRASICEMVVPYGEPGPMHSWKNAFDVGEWGLGRMADSLTLGCDCLGEIRYLDAVLTDERGRPYTLTNAICIHEEDYGILWKHLDMYSGAPGGPAIPAARGQLHRHRGQLRVRLLLVLLPRRHGPARGEADRDHVHHGHRSGSARAALPASWHRGSPPRTTSTSFAPVSTSRSTAPTTPWRRWTACPFLPARTIPGATPSKPR